MTTKTFIVDFELTRTLTYNSSQYQVEVELEDGLCKYEIEDIIREFISNDIDNEDCDFEEDNITINSKKKVPTLEQMRPTECLKCEVFNNICKKCTYYINNKCDGK